MALGRVSELSVGANGQGLLISALDMEFKVEKTATLAENTGEYTIYNAKEDTRKNVLKKGNNIIHSLGYEDEAVATVFVGNIITSYSEKVQADWVTKIKASTVQSKDAALEVVTVSLSYAPGTPVSRPLQSIASAAGLVVSGITNISSLTMPNGWTYAGTFKGALRYIKNILDSNDIGMYIDNNEIVIFNNGIASRYKVVLLSYTGGLQSVRDITKAEEQKKRIEFTSIIIPQIRINGIVSIVNTPDNNGSYIVDKLTLTGNNSGGAFKMIGEATA